MTYQTTTRREIIRDASTSALKEVWPTDALFVAFKTLGLINGVAQQTAPSAVVTNPTEGSNYQKLWLDTSGGNSVPGVWKRYNNATSAWVACTGQDIARHITLVGTSSDPTTTAPTPRYSVRDPLLSGGLLYTELGKTVMTLLRGGQILGHPWGAIAEGSESAENLISFSTDSVLLIGPSDRPDVIVETPCFSDITIRRVTHTFTNSAVGTTPPGGSTATLTGTGSFNVIDNGTYSRIARLSTGATSGSVAKLEMMGCDMQVFNSCRLMGFNYLGQSTDQAVYFGYSDTALDNYIRFERVDGASEGQWFGAIRIGGGAPVSVGLGGYMSGLGRRFMAIYVTPTGVEFYGGDATYNLPSKIGTYTGAIPTAAMRPGLWIQNTAAANKDLFATTWQAVFPG